MTSLTRDDNQAAYQIRSFVPGTIQVNDKIITHNLIISAEQLIENWAPQTAAEISKESLEAIAALAPEILIIGTGETQVFIPLAVYGDFLNQKIGVEIMSTSAACRTFNVLTAENRRVVAALILR